MRREHVASGSVAKGTGIPNKLRHHGPLEVVLVDEHIDADKPSNNGSVSLLEPLDEPPGGLRTPEG